MKIRTSFLVFLVVAVTASINDIIIYVTKIDNYNLTLAISAVIVIGVIVLLKKLGKIELKNDFEKADLFFIIPISIVYMIMIFVCSYRYDVLNYHLYLQEYCFNDKVNFDFFPGRTINSYLFPLGDRMHYIFRHFLGYRYGLIFAIYTLIVLFYQTKNILKEIFPQINKAVLIIFSAVPLFLYAVYEFALSYYIDLFSAIVLLEIATIFIKQENLLQDNKRMIFTALLLGIATGIKITNLVLGAVLILAIIISEFAREKKFKAVIKQVKIKYVILALLIFLLPWIVYAVDNYMQTGNPIYPYYNSIFKSEYFDEINWSDDRYGIPNLLYAFIWPVYIAVNPLAGNDLEVVGEIWGVGYIACIAYTLIKIKNRNTTWKISTLAIVLSIVWAIGLMGYARYAIIIPVLYTIVLISTITEIWYAVRKDKVKLKLAKVAVCLIAVALTLEVEAIVIDGAEYDVTCLQTASLLIKNKSYYKEKYADIQTEDDVYEIDGVWGCINEKSGIISLIRDKDTPIYNLDKQFFEYSDLLMEKYEENVKDKKIYSITNAMNVADFEEAVEENGYETVGDYILYKNDKIQNYNEVWYIVELRYIGGN